MQDFYQVYHSFLQEKDALGTFMLKMTPNALTKFLEYKHVDLFNQKTFMINTTDYLKNNNTLNPKS